MNQVPHSREVVFQSFRRDACMELGLVLTAAGIANQVANHAGNWRLTVAGDDGAAALEELAAYRQDNPLHQSTGESSRVPVFGGAIVGAFVYAATIGLIGRASSSDATRPMWMAIGQMDSGDVMSGQLWRTVTALTLHADAQHLLSNMAFGCVFGLMAGRILGGGVAWLAIVLAGAMGNGLNAAIRSQNHLSIGASTAVFAALGVMVAHALHPRFVSSDRLLKRWSPLIAGVLLLAFVGVGGERTDVGAHVTGFFSGMVIGWLAARLPMIWLSSRWVQIAAGVIAFGIVILAWALAISLGPDVQASLPGQLDVCAS